MPEPKISVDRIQPNPDDPNEAYSSVFDRDEEDGPPIFDSLDILESVDESTLQIGEVIYLEGITLVPSKDTGPNSSVGAWRKTDYYPYIIVEESGELYALNMRSTPTYPPGSRTRLHAIGHNKRLISNLDPDKIYQSKRE